MMSMLVVLVVHTGMQSQARCAVYWRKYGKLQAEFRSDAH